MLVWTEENVELTNSQQHTGLERLSGRDRNDSNQHLHTSSNEKDLSGQVLDVLVRFEALASKHSEQHDVDFGFV